MMVALLHMCRVQVYALITEFWDCLNHVYLIMLPNGGIVSSGKDASADTVYQGQFMLSGAHLR